MSRVKVTVTVPVKDADKVRKVLGEVGAGVQGEYSYCSFSVTGKGRFLPSKEANPHVGKSGELESVEEERIEVGCGFEAAKPVVAKIREVHPYEEPVIDIYPLIDEGDL